MKKEKNSAKISYMNDKKLKFYKIQNSKKTKLLFYKKKKKQGKHFKS